MLAQPRDVTVSLGMIRTRQAHLMAEPPQDKGKWN